MDLFFERLRDDLRPRYELVRELGAGGMGAVFLAQDTRLGRPVAIKAIRPELASATALERFRLEAQRLAALRHPNVVAVHDVISTPHGDELYVMDYLAGETLADRLERGVLPRDEVSRLGLAVLSALAAVHRAGLIHRDIKPSNIVLTDTGPMLIDFGVAKSSGPDVEPLTGTGQVVGTALYMPPEQSGTGGHVTPRSDLYALGMVLYEALTGIVWPVVPDSDRAEWSGVPAEMQPALRRALTFDPAGRWADAEEFALALTGARRARVPWLRVGIGAAFVLLGVVVVRWLWPPAPPPLADVVIFPFETRSGLNASLGSDVARNIGYDLQYLPHLQLVSPLTSFRCYEDSTLGADPGRRRSNCGESARMSIEGRLGKRPGDSIEVKLWFYARKGGNPDDTTIVDRAESTQALASAAAAAIARRATPRLDTLFGSLQRPRLEAWKEFLTAEDAFQRDDWFSAERSYERAYSMDSTFALAAWWLAIVRNWRNVPVQVDLHRVYAHYHQNLPPVYQLLLQAELLPIGPARVALFERAARDYRFDAWAQLLYGNELWGRGALVGISLDSTARVLRAAQALTLRQVTAYDHLTWVFIRLGEKDSARGTLDTLKQIAVAPEALDVDIPSLFQIIYLGRFEPDSAQGTPLQVTSRLVEDLDKAVRFGVAFDVPELQLKYGALLAGTPGASGGNGHEAQGVALLTLGRAREALRHFDAAAQVFATPEARVEAAEWRALPGALGFPVIPPEEAARGTAELERWVSQPAVGARASWDLAWIALARRDTIAAARWRERLQRYAVHDSLARPLVVLLQAGLAGVRGNPAEALRLSDTVRTSPPAARARFLFVRSALHLARGAWYWRGGAGSADSAQREWLWYENADRSGWPTGPGQEGDADWALTNYARLLRTAVALRSARSAADTSRACWHLHRVAELWVRADSSARNLLAQARARAPECER